MTLGPIGEKMKSKLNERFSPVKLEVVDESARHAGHAGANPQGESHFHVEIVADSFAGQSLLACHRMVNEVLADELAARVHALTISAKAP